MPAVTIAARDFAYTLPSRIPACLVAITLVNHGSQPHQAQLFHLNAGVTSAQFQAALQHGPAAVFPLCTVAGGPNSIMPILPGYRDGWPGNGPRPYSRWHSDPARFSYWPAWHRRGGPTCLASHEQRAAAA